MFFTVLAKKIFFIDQFVSSFIFDTNWFLNKRSHPKLFWIYHLYLLTFLSRAYVFSTRFIASRKLFVAGPTFVFIKDQNIWLV